MSDRVKFWILLALLIASLVLLWYANTAANNVTVG